MRLTYHPNPPALIVTKGSRTTPRDIIPISIDHALCVAYTVLYYGTGDGRESARWARRYANEQELGWLTRAFRVTGEDIEFWLASVRVKAREGAGV